MAEMGAWAGIAAGDAEGPLWVDCGPSRGPLGRQGCAESGSSCPEFARGPTLRVSLRAASVYYKHSVPSRDCVLCKRRP